MKSKGVNQKGSSIILTVLTGGDNVKTMPRPIRIEYEDAYYHVMNRGRARQKIFHGNNYFEAFLTCLSEAHQRHGIQILCYCLMDNHYHLLVKTPEANLGRAMRHINGVYTQRHNRLKKTDGPLFRGRYKAICVEEDSYQLQLSRYIHLNPVEAKRVKECGDYPWSSYPYYIKKQKTPDWLYQQEIFAQLHAKSSIREKYRAFVEMGVDEEMTRLYSKENMVPYLGSDAFRDWAYARRVTDEATVSKRDIQLFRPAMGDIVTQVSKSFNVSESSILKSQRGRVQSNIPRWVAMYLSQEISSKRLREIAITFNLKRTESIPTTIAKLKVLLEDDLSLMRRVKKIIREYDT